MTRIFGILTALSLLAGPGQAGTLLGTWAAEPDGKGQVGHIDITRCGAAMCGTIVRVFDKAGRQITTQNVGRRILRNIQQTGPNAFGEGKIYVPILGAEYDVDLSLNGRKLKLTACNAVSICRSQTWTRVK